MKGGKCGLVAALFLATACSAGWGDPFRGLGFVQEGENYSGAWNVSRDGSTVVGSSTTDPAVYPREAFRWTESDGLVPLPHLSSIQNTVALATSLNGAVIVGARMTGAGPGNGYEPFIWTASQGMQNLGGSVDGIRGANAVDVSYDGSVVVGVGGGGSSYHSEPVRWVNRVMERLVPDSTGDGEAMGVSSDGSVVVGYTRNPASGGRQEAFRWTQTGGLALLGFMGQNDSLARAITPDGSALVGYAGGRAFRWTLAGGTMEDIGPGEARDVSADGSEVVGMSGGLAFIWTPGTGMQDLKTWLTTRYGLNLNEWTLVDANGISNDGEVIVGQGMHNGRIEAWVANLNTVPEPFSMAFMASAFVGMVGYRLRKRSDSN